MPPNSPHQRRTPAGFGLIEALTVLAVLVVMFMLTVTTFGPRRTGGHMLQNSTKVRGNHTGLVLYAQGNNSYFPGLNADGDPDRDNRALGPRYPHHPLSPSARYQILLENNFFTGEYAISSAEVKTTWTTGVITTVNYSYAMLNVPPEDSPRRGEWRDTINTEAVILSDRLALGEPEHWVTHRSIHTPVNRPRWHGNVGWNDNHVTWETISVRDETKYADGPLIRNDNLFHAAGSADAWLIYGDAAEGR